MTKEAKEIGKIRGVGTAALREAEKRDRQTLEGGASRGDVSCGDVSRENDLPAKGKKKGKSARGRHNKELGRRGEDAAAVYLERRGYDILARNWTCIAGEADLVVTDGNYLVFVEVKTRTDTDKGFPAEAVTAKKRERYERIAALFLQDYEVSDICVRFDVVSIISYGTDRAFIKHHINAFAQE